MKLQWRGATRLVATLLIFVAGTNCKLASAKASKPADAQPAASELYGYQGYGDQVGGEGARVCTRDTISTHIATGVFCHPPAARPFRSCCVACHVADYAHTLLQI